MLPHTYQIFNSTLLKQLLKKVSEIPDTLEYDAFGRIYEYFLGEFARTEGQKGGEFFTPSSIVRLIVEIIEPYHGRILDPACGSGGMFVQSARFVEEHRKNPSAELSHLRPGAGRRDRAPLPDEPRRPRARRRYPPGEHLLRRPARQRRQFDFVMANPPFNVNAVDKDRLKDAVGRPPLSLRPAAHRQRQLSLDPAFLFRAQRKRPRRFRHGQLPPTRAAPSWKSANNSSKPTPST